MTHIDYSGPDMLSDFDFLTGFGFTPDAPQLPHAPVHRRARRFVVKKAAPPVPPRTYRPPVPARPPPVPARPSSIPLRLLDVAAGVAPRAARPEYLEDDMGHWRAVFKVEIIEYITPKKRGDPPRKRVAKHTHTGWAVLNGEELKRLRAVLNVRMATDSDGTMGPKEMAHLFGWGQWYEHSLSNDGYVTLTSLTRSDVHEVGAWDAKGVKLHLGGAIQPTIGAYAGAFVKGGSPIARIEFFREDSCMPNLFLERFSGKLKTFTKDLNHESLYRIATGLELAPGKPAGVTLEESEKWLKKWRLSARAIDISGRLVWRYDHENPVKNIPGGHVWRLLVHNEHVWLCDNDEKKFDNTYGGRKDEKKVEIRPLFDPDISSSLSDKWKRSPKPSGVPPVFVTSVEEAMATSHETRVVITNKEPEALFVEAVDSKYEPGDVKLTHFGIEAFTLRRAGSAATVRVCRAIDSDIRGDQSPVVEAMAKKGQVAFESWLYSLRECFQPAEGISTYSESLKAALQAYPRGPRCGRLSDYEGEVVGFDVGRAYTKFLGEIEFVPVFSVFDEFQPYDGGDINHYAFYLIKVSIQDPILFPSKYDMVPGKTVEYARRKMIDLEIRGVITPHRLVATLGKEALMSMYEDEEVSDKSRKAIANITYGLCSKKQNTKQVASVYMDEKEAGSSGGHVVPIGKAFISVKQGTKPLSEGYVLVGRLVLDSMRRTLHRLVSALGEMAVGVRTDCVYVKPEHEHAAELSLKDAGFELFSGHEGWERVGKIRKENKPSMKMETFLGVDNGSIIVPKPPPIPKFSEIEMKDEWSSDEADLLVPKLGDPSLAIRADCPGAGKSYLVKSWQKRHDLIGSTINVVPTNELKSDYTKEGLKCITLHDLVGMLPEGERMENEDVKKTPYDVTGITHVNFDEVYLFRVKELQWIRAFMKKHEGVMTFTMEGDPGQNMPIMQELSVNFDSYYEAIFARMFPRRLTLRINKRCKDPSDRERMKAMCEALKEEVLPVEKILADAGLVQREFDTLTKEDAEFPHLCAMKSTMARVDKWAHREIMGTDDEEYEIGAKFLGNGSYRSKGVKINSNVSYTVVDSDGTNIWIVCPEGGNMKISAKTAKNILKRPHCRTCHSAQGLSLGDTIYIHDWKSRMADHRWVRTAVSRCGTMDIRLVNGSDGASSRPSLSKSKIAECLEADPRQMQDCVDADWVKRWMKYQKYCCAACKESLEGDDWEIKKIEEDLPYLKSNCQIVHGGCQ